MFHVDIVSCKGDNCYTIHLEGIQRAPIIHGGLWRLRKGSWSPLIQEKQAQASKGTMPEKTQHCVGFQQEFGYAPITACGPKLHVFPYLELLMVWTFFHYWKKKKIKKGKISPDTWMWYEIQILTPMNKDCFWIESWPLVFMPTWLNSTSASRVKPLDDTESHSIPHVALSRKGAREHDWSLGFCFWEWDMNT